MPHDEQLALRVRRILGEQPGLEERRMFGGLAFLVHGNMCCGVSGDLLIVRVGAAAFEEVLTLAYARPMDMTGRPMRGWVFVEPTGTESDHGLAEWVGRGLDFVLSLPRKSAGAAGSRRSA